MNKVYRYSAEKNILKEQPRMEKPEHPKPRTLSYQNAVYEWQCAMIKYEKHLSSLSTYPTSGFGKEHEGRDLAEGVDFELVGLPTQSHVPVTPGSLTVTAVPIYDERDSVMTNYREFDFNEAFTGFEIGHIKAVMDIYASKFHAGIIKNNNHD